MSKNTSQCLLFFFFSEKEKNGKEFAKGHRDRNMRNAFRRRKKNIFFLTKSGNDENEHRVENRGN